MKNFKTLSGKMVFMALGLIVTLVISLGVSGKIASAFAAEDAISAAALLS